MKAETTTRRRGPIHGVALLAVAAILGGGCRVVGPNYVRPSAPAPPAWGEAPPSGWQSAQPQDTASKGNWWEIYDDAGLNALESQVAANFSLQSAQAQFEQARALIRYYRGDALPTGAVNPAATPQRYSANRPLSTGPPAVTQNDYLLPFDVSWEPDLWGRVRREVEQQRATAQAQAGDVANLRLSLQAEVAMDYFQVRSLDAQAQLLNDTVQADTRSLDLTVVRHAGGVAAGVDVAQAQTELESTRAQAQDLQVERTQLEHAIAVLTGQPPAQFHLSVAPLAATPPAVPVGIPAQLLERRPDIAAAERQVEATSAAIGVAKSAYYPTITLAAGVGLESTSVGNLFTLPSALWSLSAGAAETAFDGGQRRAQVEQSQQGYDAQVATYRQTVLSAFQEVEDNLAALRVLEAESQTEQNAVTAAKQSLALSTARYQGGVTTYLEVLVAQDAALTQQRTALDLLSRRMTASVLLVKALGGGWSVSQMPALAASSRP